MSEASRANSGHTAAPQGSVALAALCALLVSTPSALAAPPADGGAAPDAEAALEAEVAPESDPADAKRKAREWFEKAVAEAKAKRFVAAAEAFDASYDAIPAAATLFNAAWAYDHGEDWVRATQRYRSYLARYPNDADAAEVETSLVRVEAKVGELRVRVVGGQAPLVLRIGGELSALDGPPLVLLPGLVRVEVSDASGQTRIEDVQLRAAQRSTVELTLAVAGDGGGDGDGDGDGDTVEGPPAPSGPSAPSGAAGTQDRPRAYARPTMWTGVALASAGVVGVAVLGPLTQRESKRFDAALCENPCAEGSSYPSAIESRWRGYKAGTNAMIGVAAVGATTALVFGLIARKSKRAEARRESAGESEARMAPTSSGFALRF